MKNLSPKKSQHGRLGVSMANNGSTENSIRTRVRRRLFQNYPNDNEISCSPLFRPSFKSNIAEAREKWNFDFENETPLEGNWVWTKISAESNNNIETEENHNRLEVGTTQINRYSNLNKP